ncbi:MAG: acyl-CoA thioesterase [Planctomycetes bacterium]|nr:acyl-CoA thioesterase [Planctomycetota bacterium]
MTHDRPRHEFDIRVRYVETDPMGFLHHSHYFTYFEMGRTELFRASGGDYRKMEESGLFLVVAEIACKFRAPARYDDVLTVRTTLADIGPIKIEHDYELLRDGKLLASAHSVLACVDRNGRLTRMPDEIFRVES